MGQIASDVASHQSEAAPAPLMAEESFRKQAAAEFAALMQREFKTRAEVPLDSTGRAVPKDLDGVVRLAQYAHQSGLGPSIGGGDGEGTKTKMTLAQYVIVISAGQAAGLNWIQSLQWVMIVNDRPSIWGDGAIAIVLNHPKCVDVDERLENDDPSDRTKLVAVCRAVRKLADGSTKTIERRFSWADATQAKLIGKNTWMKYPKRMLQMRARAWCLRDGFADALMGLSIVEEVQDYEEPPEPPAKSLKKEAESLPAPTEPMTPLVTPTVPVGGEKKKRGSRHDAGAMLAGKVDDPITLVEPEGGQP